MVLMNSGNAFLLVVIAAFLIVGEVKTDFVLPPNVTRVDAGFFTHTAMRVLFGAEPPTTFEVMKASMDEFPALRGNSVSYAVLQYPAGSVNPAHNHPRSSELLFLLTGSLEVGLVDTSNKLHVQTLQAGDMFVFSKGFIHYEYNNGQDPAFALSAFGSANAGTVCVPGSVFATGIRNDILAKSFEIDVSTVQKIKGGLVPKAYIEN
ncbi:germin-like protein 9-3 [Cornus florida]|uniref:germin-like protein 9-3 n=1 Tax=Cornus florida TaxID=4283 RepID=UPI00289C1AF0|nr:germin-like protein 9-3 [Cornus florida]